MNTGSKRPFATNQNRHPRGDTNVRRLHAGHGPLPAPQEGSKGNHPPKKATNGEKPHPQEDDLQCQQS